MKGWTLETEAQYVQDVDTEWGMDDSGVCLRIWTLRDVGRHDFGDIPRTPQSRHQKAKQKSRICIDGHFLRVFGMGDCHRGEE